MAVPRNYDLNAGIPKGHVVVVCEPLPALMVLDKVKDTPEYERAMERLKVETIARGWAEGDGKGRYQVSVASLGLETVVAPDAETGKPTLFLAAVAGEASKSFFLQRGLVPRIGRKVGDFFIKLSRRFEEK